jgi:hypothetical protein
MVRMVKWVMAAILRMYVISRRCDERSDEAIRTSLRPDGLASRSLSSGAYSRDSLARNAQDG